MVSALLWTPAQGGMPRHGLSSSLRHNGHECLHSPLRVRTCPEVSGSGPCSSRQCLSAFASVPASASSTSPCLGKIGICAAEKMGYVPRKQKTKIDPRNGIKMGYVPRRRNCSCTDRALSMRVSLPASAVASRRVLTTGRTMTSLNHNPHRSTLQLPHMLLLRLLPGLGTCKKLLPSLSIHQ